MQVNRPLLTLTIEGLPNTGKTALGIEIRKKLRELGLEVEIRDSDFKPDQLDKWAEKTDTAKIIAQVDPLVRIDFKHRKKEGLDDRSGFAPPREGVTYFQGVKPVKAADDPKIELSIALDKKAPLAAAKAKFIGELPALVPVEIKTNVGSILLELYADKAPQAVGNFIGYARTGFYDGKIFHRVIPGFMVQAGGFTMEGSTEAKNRKLRQHEPMLQEVQNEGNNGLKNDKFTIAMARTSAPHSANAQWFINVADNGFLNHTAPTAQGWGYAVFGKVIGGHQIVEQITKIKTSRVGFHDDVPVEDIVIESVREIANA